MTILKLAAHGRRFVAVSVVVMTMASVLVDLPVEAAHAAVAPTTGGEAPPPPAAPSAADTVAPSAPAPAQLAAGVGVAGVEHVAELTGLDLAVEVDGFTAGPPPPPWRLVVVEVVVDRAPGAAVPALLVLGQPRVVPDQLDHARPGRLQGGHPQHGNHPAPANALVCPFSASM